MSRFSIFRCETAGCDRATSLAGDASKDFRFTIELSWEIELWRQQLADRWVENFGRSRTHVGKEVSAFALTLEKYSGGGWEAEVLRLTSIDFIQFFRLKHN
ncbi:hypothetical protein [Microcoleus sp. bin38.metabat.b11b12b14.051]|uniref:hypothetical protein n=1 Tax=Microcoleus sp. bin38.metabat.b11b12b14.051 TaxID=2742709 RepID=UPI0025D2A854|nr:hypothetical protein [Microcoleus sp. bin38.metabat.b11b12b14.051]